MCYNDFIADHQSDALMCHLILWFRESQDYTKYPPNTLYCPFCCFKHFYESNGIHDVNPLNGIKMLDAEMKRLHCLGKGTVQIIVYKHVIMFLMGSTDVLSIRNIIIMFMVEI